MKDVKENINTLNDIAADNRKSIIAAGVLLAMAATDIIMAITILIASKTEVNK